MNNRWSFLNHKPLGSSLVLSIFVSGCVVGPDYETPAIDTPATWSAQASGSTTSSPAEDLSQWWAVFDTPQLTELIDNAIANNPDQKRARARLREARALRAATHAGRYPTLDASGSASSSYSEDQTGASDWRELYSTGLDASWELDLFGGVRRSVEAADANLEAREADYIDVMTSLVAEVARAYVDITTLQERIRLTHASLQARKDAFDLTRWRAEAGLTDALDLEQARADLESTRAQIPALESDLAASLNQLSVLIGEAPGGLDQHIDQSTPTLTAPADISVGIPADILRRRPDIRAAERDLAAQSARVGVATADLYPRFRLTGAFGFSALGVSDLFDSASRNDSFAASFSAPLFNAGAIRRNIEVQDAIFEQVLASYESTILLALKEVEDALASLHAARRRGEALELAVLSAETANSLAQQSYEAGLSDFSRVLDTQRTLLSLQEQLTQNKAGEITSVILLYKALGGGWAAAANE